MASECIQCLVCLHHFQNDQTLAVHVQQFQSTIICVFEQIEDVTSAGDNNNLSLADLLSRLRNLVLHYDILPNEFGKIQDEQSTDGEHRQAKTSSLLKEVDQAAGLFKLADSGSGKLQHGIRCPHEDCKESVSRKQDLLRHYALHSEFEPSKRCEPCGMSCKDAKKFLYHKCSGSRSHKRAFKWEREKIRKSVIRELDSKLQAVTHGANAYSSPSREKDKTPRDYGVDEAPTLFTMEMPGQEGMIWNCLASLYTSQILTPGPANSIESGGPNSTNVSVHHLGFGQVYDDSVLRGQEVSTSHGPGIFGVTHPAAIGGQGMYSTFDGVDLTQNQINDYLI